MKRGLLPVCRALFVCGVFGSCTLTSSLDELSGTASNGTGADAGADGSVGGAGAGGVFPGGSGGSAGSDAPAGGSAGSTAPDPPWWDASWPGRVQLFVQNQATLPLPSAFEVGFEIAPGVFSTGATTFVVAAWNEGSQSWSARPTFTEETADGKQWIWTQLPATLSPSDVESSLYLYAGKAGAGAGDPSSVFSLWDGFDSTSGEWVLQGVPSLDPGRMLLPHDSSIRSSQQWDPGFAVDYALEVDTAVSGTFDWISAGFQRSTDFDNTEPWLIWVSRDASLVQPEVDISVANAQELGATQSFLLNEEHLYGVERFSNKTVYRRDNEIAETLTWSTPYTTPMQIRFTTQSATAQISLDFVRVRRASDPPPQVSVGATESR